MSLAEMPRRLSQSQPSPPLFRPATPGNLLLRYVTARAIAGARDVDPSDVAKTLWPTDRSIIELIERAASAPALTTVTGWAAELVQTAVTDATMALGLTSAAAALFKSSLLVSFDGAGAISVPGFSADAAAAGFVAEGDPIPVDQFAALPAVLHPFKISTIAALSREMMESSNAELLIGDAFVRSCGLALDAVAFDSNAATAARPAGILFGISTTTASVVADNWTAAHADVVALVNAVAAAAGGGQIFLITSPGRALALASYYLNSGNITILSSGGVANKLIAVAANGIAAALSPTPEIKTANAATLHMEDTTPQPVVTSPGVRAAPLRSLFQTDTIALKVRWPVSWAVRSASAVAWTTPAWI